MIESWIGLPNLQTVNLPKSFFGVHSKSIKSICMNMSEWVDVSPILANLIQTTPKEIISITLNTKSISISNNSCNDKEYTIFNFSRFTLVEELIIGNDCFEYVNIFNIDGLNKLKSLKIGMNSFTKKKNSWASDSSRSFSILNCAKLESIEISRFSFSDYGGGFELRNLPKLSTIKIGEIGTDYSESNNRGWSLNFSCSSFEIKGIIECNDNE